MSSTRPAKYPPARPSKPRRPGRGRRSWWPYLIAGAVLIAIIGFVVALRFGPSTSSSPSTMSSGPPGGVHGLAVGAQAPSISLQATTGEQLAPADLHGSKVIVYFYEGGG